MIESMMPGSAIGAVSSDRAPQLDFRFDLGLEFNPQSKSFVPVLPRKDTWEATLKLNSSEHKCTKIRVRQDNGPDWITATNGSNDTSETMKGVTCEIRDFDSSGQSVCIKLTNKNDTTIPITVHFTATIESLLTRDTWVADPQIILPGDRR